MKRTTLLTFVLTMAVGVGSVAAKESPAPYLTEEERTELVRLLDESFETLLGRISGLSDEQWYFKESPDRWSVGECAQHIIRSERALLDYAKTAMRNDPDKDWFEKTKGKTGLLKQVMPNRNPGGAGGATAPMEIRPTEDWDRARAIRELYVVRGEVRAYIETLTGPVKSHIETHPFPVFGDLTAHDWLIYIPLHTIRHTKQILEVQEHPEYPSD